MEETVDFPVAIEPVRPMMSILNVLVYLLFLEELLLYWGLVWLQLMILPLCCSCGLCGGMQGTSLALAQRDLLWLCFSFFWKCTM